MPETGAWTNCDGSHYCQVCGNESCPILFHNLTLVSSSSAPQLAYPRQQTDSTAGPSVIWRLQKTLLELWLVLQGPAQLFAWFCWEPAMQIKRVPLFPVCPLWGGSCGLRYLQCSSQAASTGNRERSPVDCAVFALYISWEPFDVCLRSLDSARRLRAACVISPEKCCFHVGQGTHAEKRFPRALFCCREMFRLWWVSTELFSPFPFSPTVEWSSGFWQGKHTWQAAAPRETGPLVLGWGLGTCRSILCFSKGSARAVLQLAQGRRKNNPDIAGLLPTASVFFLICPKKHSRQALCFQALVVPACRHFCRTSAGV